MLFSLSPERNSRSGGSEKEVIFFKNVVDFFVALLYINKVAESGA